MNHPGYMPANGFSLVQVTPSLKLFINVKFELDRAEFMMPFLKQHGVMFKKAPFDDRFPRLDREARCYDNAAQLAMDYPDQLIYCEGLMLFRMEDGSVFPMPHGWCCTMDGHVVDPTCHANQLDPAVGYLGVPVYKGYVTRWHALVGFHGLLDGHHEYGKRVGIHQDHPAKWLQQLSDRLPTFEEAKSSQN